VVHIRVLFKKEWQIPKMNFSSAWICNANLCEYFSMYVYENNQFLGFALQLHVHSCKCKYMYSITIITYSCMYTGIYAFTLKYTDGQRDGQTDGQPCYKPISLSLASSFSPFLSFHHPRSLSLPPPPFSFLPQT